MAVRVRADDRALDLPAVEADYDGLWAHRPDVRAVSRRLVGDERADDVVQDTFLKALVHGPGLDPGIPRAAWLATVARRRSIDELRAARRVRPVPTLPEAAAGTVEDPLEHVVRQERVAELRAALAELGTRERQLLLRQLAHGLTLAELAAEESTSIASVRSVLARARTKLRLSLVA